LPCLRSAKERLASAVQSLPSPAVGGYLSYVGAFWLEGCQSPSSADCRGSQAICQLLFVPEPH